MLKIQSTLLLFLSLTAFAEPPYAEVQVTASGLNVRDADGNILCSVRRDESLVAIGRRLDTEALKVSVNSSRCPGIKEGFVAAKYVRPKEGVKSNQYTVDVDGLSFRSAPTYDNSWRCSLPLDTEVLGTDVKLVKAADVSWVYVKLKNPVPGCPNEGYVANSYLSSAESFRKLPVVTVTGEDCADCGATKEKDDALGALSGVSKDLNGKLNPDQTANPYVEELKKMIRNPKYRAKGFPTSRGLAQIPLIGKRGNIGPCGSHHYNPDKPVGVDAYANPLTACTFISALQDWKKKFCPNGEDGCTVAWGDISHKSKPEFSGHRTHTNGQCIDIRPMGEGDFQDAPLSYRDRRYDQKKMRQFVEFLRAKGGSNMYFNDTSLGTKAIKGHHNHIHVCFKDNKKTREACNNLQVDSNVCPELQ